MPGTTNQDAAAQTAFVKRRKPSRKSLHPVRRSNQVVLDWIILLLVVAIVVSVVEGLWGIDRLLGGFLQRLDEVTVKLDDVLRRLCGVPRYFPS